MASTALPPRRVTQILPVIIVAVLAALSYWLLQTQLRPLAPPTPEHLSHTPDYFANDFAITMLNQTGTTQYRLNAHSMVHFEDDQNTDVQLPTMRAFSPDRPPVSANAKRGVVNADGSVVDLYEDAVVTRPPGAGDPAMRADSEHFRIFANDDVVETEKPVKLQRGPSVSTANGMIYNNVTRSMQLLGDVRGTIAASDLNSQRR